MTRRLSRDQASDIVKAEFIGAGWPLIESPVVAEDEHGHLVLADGAYSEPIERTETALRVQCRAWVKSFEEADASFP